MCSATAVERSRTSAREPGSCTRRVSGAPVAHAEADRADRLVLGAPAGPGDAGDADADVGAEPRRARRRQRLGDLGRDRADAARSAPGRRPASATLASFA